MKQQETVRIPIHSLIDLITNSSTEIFVQSNGSLKPCKELINEFLLLQGSTQTCDDLFDLSLEYTPYTVDNYEEYLRDDDNGEEQIEELRRFIKGEISEPSWMETYHLETRLVIKAKDPKYTNLAKLFVKFLYSTNPEEHSWD